jgi:hypothetical protein
MEKELLEILKNCKVKILRRREKEDWVSWLLESIKEGI